MAIAQVQSGFASGGSSSATSVTVGTSTPTSAGVSQPIAATTAGNLLVALIEGQVPSSVKDATGTAWTQITSVAASGTLSIWYRENAPSVTSVTATFSVSGYQEMAVAEFSGVATSGSLDTGATAHTSGTSVSSLTIATPGSLASTGELVLFCTGDTGLNTNYNYSLGTKINPSTGVADNNGNDIGWAYEVASSSTAQSCTISQPVTETMQALVVAFKPAAGGGSGATLSYVTSEVGYYTSASSLSFQPGAIQQNDLIVFLASCPSGNDTSNIPSDTFGNAYTAAFPEYNFAASQYTHCWFAVNKTAGSLNLSWTSGGYASACVLVFRGYTKWAVDTYATAGGQTATSGTTSASVTATYNGADVVVALFSDTFRTGVGDALTWTSDLTAATQTTATNFAGELWAAYKLTSTAGSASETASFVNNNSGSSAFYNLITVSFKAGFNSYTGTPADALTLPADSLGRLGAFHSSPVDTVFSHLADSVQGIKIYLRSVAETLPTLADVASRILGAHARPSESTPTVADAALPHQTLKRTSSDSNPGIADAITALKIYLRTISDPLSPVGDSLTRLHTWVIRISDLLPIANDGPANVLGNIAESLPTISDLVTVSHTVTRTALEWTPGVIDGIVQSARNYFRRV